MTLQCCLSTLSAPSDPSHQLPQICVCPNSTDGSWLSAQWFTVGFDGASWHRDLGLTLPLNTKAQKAFSISAFSVSYLINLSACTSLFSSGPAPCTSVCCSHTYDFHVIPGIFSQFKLRLSFCFLCTSKQYFYVLLWESVPESLLSTLYWYLESIPVWFLIFSKMLIMSKIHSSRLSEQNSKQ